MKISSGAVPVYTISGSEARPLPEWLIRKRKRSLKNDPEFANRVDLLQDFEFEEASQCVRVSEDGDWVMSTGTYKPQIHVHYLPHLSLSFARHTNTLVRSFRSYYPPQDILTFAEPNLPPPLLRRQKERTSPARSMHRIPHRWRPPLCESHTTLRSRSYLRPEISRVPGTRCRCKRGRHGRGFQTEPGSRALHAELRD